MKISVNESDVSTSYVQVEDARCRDDRLIDLLVDRGREKGREGRVEGRWFGMRGIITFTRKAARAAYSIHASKLFWGSG